MERKWHIEAWLNGGCVVCGSPERGGMSHCHPECTTAALDPAFGWGECSIEMYRRKKSAPGFGKTAAVAVDAKDAIREAEKRLAPMKDVLARTLQWLHDAGPSEINAMTTKRREQMRELGREITAVINPSKGSK